jgi:hypothetical protein
MNNSEQRFELDEVALDRGVITETHDIPVRILLAEIAKNALIVNPKFQRHAVWGRDRQSMLIESLLLNIPIPMLYFAEDEDGIKVVVDGQQRLRAIDEFHSGRYVLKRLDVLPNMNGKRWADLSPKQSEAVLDRRLPCVSISAASPATLRFEMFERLSAGGLPLNDQELRNCVFRGPFNDLLHDLVRTPPWLAAVGKPDADLRMRHEELALLFFAVHAVATDYHPPVKHLLNEFMRSNRHASEARIYELAATFERALTNCLAVFGEHCFRRVVQAKGRPERWETNLNRAVYDVQMISLAGLSTDLVAGKASEIREVFSRESLTNDAFQSALAVASADRKAFYTRLHIWLGALRDAGFEQPLLDRLPRTA